MGKLNEEPRVSLNDNLNDNLKEDPRPDRIHPPQRLIFNPR